MPQFLEDKLKAEYGNNKKAIFGTMNKIGAMHGNKETALGAKMQSKHDRDMGMTTKPKAVKVGFDQRKFGGKKSARIA